MIISMMGTSNKKVENSARCFLCSLWHLMLLVNCLVLHIATELSALSCLCTDGPSPDNDNGGQFSTFQPNAQLIGNTVLGLVSRNTSHRCEDPTKEAASVALAAGAWTKMRGTGWWVGPSRKGPTQRLALISLSFSLNGDKSALMEANPVILGAPGWGEGFVSFTGGARVQEMKQREERRNKHASSAWLWMENTHTKNMLSLRGSTCISAAAPTRLQHCSMLFNWAREAARFSVSLCPHAPISRKDTLAPIFPFHRNSAILCNFLPFMPLHFFLLVSKALLLQVWWALMWFRNPPLVSFISFIYF